MPVLPAVVLCPLCKHEQLSIVEDHLAGGQWFRCRNCKKLGDMIELAAMAWEMSIEATIGKLAQEGFDIPTDSKTIHSYQASHIEYRKRLDKLLRQSRSYIYERGTRLRALLSALRLPDEFPVERWKKGAAKILGGELCRTIEEALLPGSVVCSKNEQIPRCRSSKRIFKNGGWKEALMLPFYATPGRICAFGFIGRRGDMATDYVLRHANVTPFIHQPTARSRTGNAPRHTKTGSRLAAHGLRRFRSAGLSSFAINDTFSSRRQCCHWCSGKTCYNGSVHLRMHWAWEMLHGNRIIFWDPLMDLATLRQAVDANGWIATCGPRSQQGRP